MKLISILIAAMILTQTSFAQESILTEGMPLIVIAANGLKLREGPGTQFKTITAAPFGTEVQLIEKAEMPYDTVLKFSYKHNADYIEKTNVQATWMKVKYGDQIGYMYSLYLYYKSNLRKYSGYPHINEKYQVFSRTNEIIGVVLNSPKQNYWYEIFKNPDESYSLNNIKIEMISSLEHINDCGGGMQLILQQENMQSNSSILFSRKKLATGKINSLPTHDLNDQLKSIQELQQFGRINRDEFYILKNKLLQKLSLREINSKIYFIKNGTEKPFFENWNITGIPLAADLDADGIMDYIIFFGDYNQILIGLFLSSEAENGKSHQLVATFPGYFNC